MIVKHTCPDRAWVFSRKLQIYMRFDHLRYSLRSVAQSVEALEGRHLTRVIT